ncbi:hypothetical protein LSH36_271g00019 [Paralvinella palmiformis]|uniref:Cyclin-C n=1 Tax=Paralvinella palmiformis TaxID=53620 RepID=A0AAD9JKC2_9ANNE|nr:hypothetical protein LSH36_271g00019 [Paralvinella palmiformis]
MYLQQWILDKQDLLRERESDQKVLSEEEYQKIIIFFANFIQSLGEHLKFRQQVIATATVYFKRYYARNSLRSIDPLLMAPTCAFLASKVEEFGVLSNNRLITTCQQVVKNKYGYAYGSTEFPYRISQVLECEFYLLESMDCCLILYHPYRPLLQYAQDLNQSENSSDSLLQLSWRIVNDSLRTDVALLYPPFMIALAALHMASVMQQRDTKTWFAELAVDLDKVLEVTKHILGLYELWKNYDEKKEIGSLLNKMPKPKTAPSRPPSQGPSAQDLPQQGGSQSSQPTQQDT